MAVHSIIHTYTANICYIYFVQSNLNTWQGVHVHPAVTGVGEQLLCDRQSHPG